MPRRINESTQKSSSEKNTKGFSLDDYKQEVSKVKKETLAQVEARWECRRRNKEFRKYFKGNDEKYNHALFINKWGIDRDKSLDISKSFNELLEGYAQSLINDRAMERAEAYKTACEYYVSIIGERSGRLASSDVAVHFDRDMNSDFDDTGIIKVSINLNYSKNQIEKSLNLLLEKWHPRWEELYKEGNFNFIMDRDNKLKPVKKYQYNSYPLYWKAYDMEVTGMTPTEIAKEMFPEAFGEDRSYVDHNDARSRVKKYCNEARRLINYASLF